MTEQFLNFLGFNEKSFFVCVKMENSTIKIRTLIFFKVMDEVGGQAI